MIKEKLHAMKERFFGRFEWIVDFTDQIPKHDVKKSRISSALGYLFFMIPVIMNDEQQFARFHCNQSLINLILSTAGAMFWGMIPRVGPYLMVLQEVLCFIFLIRGMILSFQGKARSIPLVGWITICAYRYPGQ